MSFSLLVLKELSGIGENKPREISHVEFSTEE